MSFRFEVTGFLRQQRDQTTGEFTDGDVLPAEMTDELRSEVESQNPGSSELAADAYSHARDVAHGIGVPDRAKFKIIVNGHYNDGIVPSAATYVQMGVQLQP
jgi:hypothetical protein